MYFFYFDESGSRDPSVGTMETPKDHIYVLTAVGMWEGRWRNFERGISNVKLELADYLRRDGKGRFELADCEVKSNWIRQVREREKKSPFLSALPADDLEKLVSAFYQQMDAWRVVVMTAVVDKRHLHDHITHETLHKKAYEFLLERIEHFLAEYHPKHKSLIIMDDTSRELNRAVAMKHAWFQRAGNQHVGFRHIVEYPFFTASELSNGVQLADLVAYNFYRAFKEENLKYSYFERMIPRVYRRKSANSLDGLKVWPDDSPLLKLAKDWWSERIKNRVDLIEK